MLQLNTVTDLPSIFPPSPLTRQRGFALPPGAAARLRVFAAGVLQRAGVGQRCGCREAALLPKPRGEGKSAPSLSSSQWIPFVKHQSGCKSPTRSSWRKQTNLKVHSACGAVMFGIIPATRGQQRLFLVEVGVEQWWK